jgi:hypothetical protein
MTLLWLVDTWSTGRIPENDFTWFVSSGIRLVTFLGLTALSFLATYRAQPARLTPGSTARPKPSSLRLRVIAAACAALFFGDLSASSFAEQSSSWVASVEIALLALLTLTAVVAVALGRATLRLWREAGGDMPVWSEPTEAAVNLRISSIGAQTVWLGVFLMAWLLAHDLPALVSLVTRRDSVSLTLMLEGVAIALVGIAHYTNRELVQCGPPHDERTRRLDVLMAVIGTALSAEVGIRIVLAYDDLPPIGFWLGVTVCLLGLIASAGRLLRSSSAHKRPAD